MPTTDEKQVWLKWEDTGGKPAVKTGADKQMQQVWPIRRHGAGAVMRRENRWQTGSHDKKIN